MSDDWFDFRVIDAFTTRPFSGNPAAVVLPHPGRPLERKVQQAIAAEMNLSETAFPSPEDDEGIRELRWFTPTTEVSLCGHATLATAHALLEEGGAPPFRFRSRSGVLNVALETDDGGGAPAIRLDFPADPPNPGPPPRGLMSALGCFEETPFAAGARCGLVILPDERSVRDLKPDIAALRRVPLPIGMLGVSVTAPAAGRSDFISRFFGPWVGVDEDPVTGMAHCVLGPYWARELERSTLEARQLSRRGGEIRIRVQESRVHLIGHAVTMARGTLRVPASAAAPVEVRSGPPS